jgi:HAD superfamily hydrolase (TIGR01549 family)
MTERVRGVILDIDGTLVNSNDAHARAWVEALAEVDVAVEFAAVRRLIGMGGDKILPAIASIEAESKLGERVAERRAEIFRQRHLPQLHAFPKTRELLLRMKSAGIQLAIASSARKEELVALLSLARVDDLIEGATSSSDARSSKPDPDIVAAALVQLALGAPHVVMIGDTPYDIEAAARAGIRSIAFRSGGRSDHDLAGAIAIYDGSADLLAHFDTSPLATKR